MDQNKTKQITPVFSYYVQLQLCKFWRIYIKNIRSHSKTGITFSLTLVAYLLSFIADPLVKRDVDNNMVLLVHTFFFFLALLFHIIN